MAFRNPPYVQSNQLAEQTAARPLTEQSGMPKAQFINITESSSLDKASRTQVRVQAMRDYHRRRTGNTDNDIQPKAISQKPLSAKAQTRKFRLGEENLLRPWVPVKVEQGLRSSGYRRDGHSSPGRKETNIEPKTSSPIQDDIPSPARKFLQEEDINSQQITSTYSITASLDPWISTVDFILKTSNLYDPPGAGRLDPFSAMSLVMTPRTETLIHHYFNVNLQSAWLMMPMRKMLFSLAIHDPAMFHSFITHYAAKFNVQSNTKSSSESLYHATMAAKLINERLANSSLALTDETIATVANMAAYESSNGTAASMIVHMNGLEKMVIMRGGIENGGFPLIVQRMIGWTDYHVATSLLQKPRFPPLRLPQTAQPQQAVQVSNGSTAGQAENPPPSLEFLLSNVQQLSTTLRILRKRASMPDEDIWYSDKIYYLQRNLFDIAHDTSYHMPIDSVCALAALIYCGHCLRDIPLSYAVTSKAVTRLQRALELYETFNLWMGDLQLTKKMYWILAFGGIAAQGKSERAWFVQKFRFCSFDLQLNTWETARSMLVGVLWEPGLDDAGIRLFEDANREEE